MINKSRICLFFLTVHLMLFTLQASSQKNNTNVIAYYSGGPDKVEVYAADKLTHIIFSFATLKDNKLHIKSANDSATIRKMVGLKKRNSKLKVLLAFGGWGGCNTCSEVFSSKENREVFAQSAKAATDYFGTDGIDLDWEYPALPSVTAHRYKPEDKQNFTLLVQALRKELGNKHEMSFAAGASKKFIEQSVEWGPVMKLVDRVNVMTYDFYTGATTGHNAALYSTNNQTESADYTIQTLLNNGVPANKIVVGAAFYTRIWENVPAVNNGLYQQGKSAGFTTFRDLDAKLPVADGFVRYWDPVAHATYIYNKSLKKFASFESEEAVKEKTAYAIKKGLNGIMFWQLTQDKYEGGLLEAIDEVIQKH